MSVDVEQTAAALDQRLGEPPVFRPPDGWTLTASWRRAQEEKDIGGPVNAAYRQVFLEGSERPHRVLFAIYGGELRAECDLDGHCPAYRYRKWCAHLGSCWWRWVRGDLAVTDLDTERTHLEPPAWLPIRAGSPTGGT
jgi:hypothetical protein